MFALACKPESPSPRCWRSFVWRVLPNNRTAYLAGRESAFNSRCLESACWKDSLCKGETRPCANLNHQQRARYCVWVFAYRFVGPGSPVVYLSRLWNVDFTRFFTSFVSNRPFALTPTSLKSTFRFHRALWMHSKHGPVATVKSPWQWWYSNVSMQLMVRMIQDISHASCCGKA